jgi:hypothetical protein
MPEKLERQVRILVAHPEAAMLYGPGLYWHPENPSRDFVQNIGFTEQTVCPPPFLARRFLEDSAGTPGPTGMLLRTESVKRLGGFVEEFTGMYEDQAFCFRLATRAAIVASPEVWYRYRQHVDSCCAVASAQGRHDEARRHFLDSCLTYVREHCMEDTELLALLTRERRAVGMRHRASAALRRAVGRLLSPAVRTWLREHRL